MLYPSAVLFPHAILPEAALKRVVSFLGPLTIFMPWDMDLPSFYREGKESRAVRIMNPPEALRPEKELLSLLTEYRHWIINNRDRGYTEFLKVHGSLDASEENTWKIRQRLRPPSPCTSVPGRGQATGWHLILHLAGETEGHCLEADDLLRRLRRRGPLLKGIIEDEEDTEDLFKDLPGFDTGTCMGDHLLPQIFDAWVSLFHEYLHGEEALVTINPQVMDYLSGMWSDLEMEITGKITPSVRFSFPDFSQYGFQDLIHRREDFYKSDKGREIMDMVLDPTRDTAWKKDTIEGLDGQPTSLPRGGPWTAELHITLRHLSPVRGARRCEARGFSTYLSDRTLILVEADG